MVRFNYRLAAGLSSLSSSSSSGDIFIYLNKFMFLFYLLPWLPKTDCPNKFDKILLQIKTALLSLSSCSQSS